MSKAKVEELKKFENVKVRGLVKKAYNGKTKYDEESKNRLTIYAEDFDYSIITAYDDTPAKLTPKWYKEAAGYINLSSSYNIEVKTTKGSIIDFEDWISDYDTHNADVTVKFRQKDGAIYPICLVVHKDGDPVDNFADM